MSAIDTPNEILVEASQVSEKDIVVVIGDVDNFKPSPLRFLVAALLCISSGLSGYILQTYVTIWYDCNVKIYSHLI